MIPSEFRNDAKELILCKAKRDQGKKEMIFSRLDKETKRELAVLIFGKRNTLKKVKKKPSSTKEDRIKKAYESHLNSTLNKEKKLLLFDLLIGSGYQV